MLTVLYYQIERFGTQQKKHNIEISLHATSPLCFSGRKPDLDSLLFLFSHSALSNSLWHHELQHTRLPCPLLSPGVYTNSCSLNWWCHPAISSSVTPSSSCSRSFPAKSGSFPMSWLYTTDERSTRDSASASVLLMYSQGWFPFRIGWFDHLAI